MIVDRDQDIAKLNAMLAQVTRTGGIFALVSGEAGIGKSTFVEAFLAQSERSCRSAIAWCDPLNTPRPLGPVRDLTMALLPGDLSEYGEADFFDGIIAYAQSARRPLVLVIEDLHWVDQKTLDWLIFLGRRLSQLPVLLIGTFRDDEIGPDHPIRTAVAAISSARKSYVELSPLSIEAVRHLGQGRSGGFSAEELHHITGGHPYFVAELMNSDTPDAAPPQSVADVIHARLARLPAKLRRFLETVSCAPQDLSYALLQHLPFDGLMALCDEAVARRFLVSTGPGFKFRHELARRAIGAGLGPAQTRDAHAQLLTAHLAQPDGVQEPDTIVFHAEGAQDQEILLNYAQKAADKAAALGAHREAALHLGAGLACLDGQETELAAEMNERWAYEAGLSLGIDDEVVAARERAVALWRKLDRPERLGENLRWLSRLHWYRGEAEQAERYITEALDVLENEARSSEIGKAYALRAQFLMLQERMDDAVEWAERARAVASSTDDFETQAHALNTSGSAKLFRGDLEGEGLLRESLAISQAHALHEQAARVYTNLSECLIEIGALDRAEALLEEGIAFDTAHDLDAWTYYLIGRKAQLRFEQDRYDEAAVIARSVLDQPNQTMLMQLPARIILARCGLRTGAAAAANLLEEALSHADQIGEPQYQVTLLIALLEQSILTGGSPEHALHRLASIDPAQISPAKQSDYQLWAHLAGHSLPPEPMPLAYARCCAADYEAAAEQWNGENRSYLAGWAFAKVGTNASVAKADALFDSCGAIAARQALRDIHELPPLKVAPRGPYGPARDHPYALTGKEQTVLAMMGQGKSNTVIADEMSRSRRTIENHVSSILSKLNCQNRIEAILRMQSEPWILPDA